MGVTITYPHKHQDQYTVWLEGYPYVHVDTYMEAHTNIVNLMVKGVEEHNLCPVCDRKLRWEFLYDEIMTSACDCGWVYRSTKSERLRITNSEGSEYSVIRQ